FFLNPTSRKVLLIIWRSETVYHFTSYERLVGISTWVDSPNRILNLCKASAVPTAFTISPIYKMVSGVGASDTLSERIIREMVASVFNLILRSLIERPWTPSLFTKKLPLMTFG